MLAEEGQIITWLGMAPKWSSVTHRKSGWVPQLHRINDGRGKGSKQRQSFYYPHTATPNLQPPYVLAWLRIFIIIFLIFLSSTFHLNCTTKIGRVGLVLRNKKLWHYSWQHISISFRAFLNIYNVFYFPTEFWSNCSVKKNAFNKSHP